MSAKIYFFPDRTKLGGRALSLRQGMTEAEPSQEFANGQAQSTGDMPLAEPCSLLLEPEKVDSNPLPLLFYFEPEADTDFHLGATTIH